MRLAHGNMFNHPADLILVTTNSFVRSDGTLVMGRGAAREMRNHSTRNLELVFGRMVNCFVGRGIYKRYGVLIDSLGQGSDFGIFQVKYHWGKPAIPELIEYSASCLTQLANGPYANRPISLNYPGIGNGGLTREVVEPLIQGLPENVTVWERD